MGADKEMYKELYRVIESTYANEADKIQIGEQLYAMQIVKDRLFKLTEENLTTVRENIKNYAGEIKRMDRYMLSALFHASETEAISLYQKQNREEVLSRIG